MPAPPSTATLSSFQNRAYQYICQMMSVKDLISNDYLKQELGNNEQYSVSQIIV